PAPPDLHGGPGLWPASVRCLCPPPAPAQRPPAHSEMTIVHTRNSALALLAFFVLATSANAQTGVSDDRVSLPDGPGSLDGLGDNASVGGNMGQMTYSVPIAVPEYFDEVTPELSFDYSSGSGSGPLGIGWSLGAP